MKNKILAILAVALMGSAGAANAITTDTLANLVRTGGSLSIGDKTFSGFDFHATGLTGFDASQIEVSASIVGGVYYLTWGGAIDLISTGPAVADLLLNYTVTANPGQIVMIDQGYTGSAQGTGASLAVDETVKLADGTIVGNSHLQVGDLSDPFSEPGDNLIISPPQSVLYVTKDIGLGLATGGFITISQVEQSFHQNIPDGGMTIMLLGAGLAGLGLLRKKVLA